MAIRLPRLPLLCATVFGLIFSIAALPTRAQTPEPLDPAAFELNEMGRIEGGVSAIASDGDLLAVVSGRMGIFYDLSDATRPRTLSTIILPANSAAVQIGGEFAYVTWGNCSEAGACSGGFDVYDLALPTAPTRVAQILTPTEIWYHLTLVGPTVYAGSITNASTYVIDVRIPTVPVMRTTTDILSIQSATFVARADLGGQEYSYFITQNGLTIYDLAAERQINQINFPETHAFITSIVAVDLPDARHMLYLSDRRQGLRVIDLTDPTAPIVHPTIKLSNPHSIVAGSGALYVATGDWPATFQLYVIDLANPLVPTISGPIPNREPSLLLHSGERLISVDAHDGITFLDLAEPLNPQPLGAIPLTADSGYAYTNGYVLTYNTWQGLRALDISRPTAAQVHPSGLAATYGAPATLAASER